MTDSPADLLVVFAGADFRKQVAVRAWREGAARAIAVAVARFEWRRIPALGLPGDGGLPALVHATPPPKRLFVLLARGDRTEARLVAKGRWGTWSEARAFAALARDRGARTLLVCTSGYHLPRSMQALRRAFAALGVAGIALRPFPAPEPIESPLHPSRRWRSPRAWRALAREAFKGIVYAIGIPMSIEPAGLASGIEPPRPDS